MNFQGIPDVMPPEHYRADRGIFGFLNLWLFIVFTCLLIGFGIYFLLKARHQEVESAKRIKIGFGLFGIFYGICRIFFILMFQDFTNPAQNYDLFANIAYSFGMAGFLSVIWALERAKYEKRYFFLLGLLITLITVAGVVLILLDLGSARETILIVITLGSPLAGLFILLLYLQLYRLSTGIVKKKAKYSLIGFIIMIIGITMDGQWVLGVAFIPLFVKMVVVPIVAINGFILFIIPNK